MRWVLRMFLRMRAMLLMMFMMLALLVVFVFGFREFMLRAFCLQPRDMAWRRIMVHR